MGAPAAGDRLVVGRIGRAHGLRGEVAVRFTSNRPERAEAGAVLHVGDRQLVVAASRPHQDRVLVRFEGVDDRTAAEALQGLELTAAPLGDEVELDDDEVWVHEIVGAEVRDRSGEAIGRVAAVEANPAHDLLVLDDGALVPMVFVVEQRDGVVVIDPPDGLFDL
ncbi:MAG TPA: ribosome maturation factor RimM [Acidimicrobiia bacterium]|nr:ribosome maturation factor RimM [Acidimicrobiia bacterium]